MTDPGQAGRLASLASLLECSVDKPGNVGPGRDFSDTTYGDFLLSCLVLGEHCKNAACGSNFGRMILGFVEECRRIIGKNTHLGTAILFMPLASAAGSEARGPQKAKGISITDLQSSLESTLRSAGPEDSITVCRAIRLMEPSGLRDPCFSGPPVEDIVRDIEENEVGYVEWMERGAELDGVAFETAAMYHRVFRWASWLLQRDSIRSSVLELYINMLAEAPDTLVAGTCGQETALEFCGMAKQSVQWLANGDDGLFFVSVRDMSSYCQEKHANPGTTADLTGASIYAALLCGGRP